jgi:hypothetical protein
VYLMLSCYFMIAINLNTCSIANDGFGLAGLE